MKIKKVSEFEDITKATKTIIDHTDYPTLTERTPCGVAYLDENGNLIFYGVKNYGEIKKIGETVEDEIDLSDLSPANVSSASLAEIVKLAIYGDVDFENGTPTELQRILKVAYYAYYCGIEQKAAEAERKLSKIYAEQTERAEACRYRNMAKKIIGETKHYDADASRDVTKTFGKDTVRV